MCFTSAFQEELAKSNISQKEVAKRASISPSLISKIKNGHGINYDNVRSISEALGAPHLIAEYISDEGLGFFNVPTLNNVDKHPIVVLESLEEEGSEMIKAASDMKKLLKNKRSQKDLTIEQREELFNQVIQVADLYAGINILLLIMRDFGIEIKDVEKAIHDKVIEKGYHIHKKRTTTRAVI